MPQLQQRFRQSLSASRRQERDICFGPDRGDIIPAPVPTTPFLPFHLPNASLEIALGFASSLSPTSSRRIATPSLLKR